MKLFERFFTSPYTMWCYMWMNITGAVLYAVLFLVHHSILHLLFLVWMIGFALFFGNRARTLERR